MTPAMQVLLATRSEHKAREIREILGPLPHTVLVTPDELGLAPVAAEDDVEGYDTFADNAAAKARHFAARSGIPALADDSGLVVDALGGEPGVRSKRFSGRTDLTGEDLDGENNRLILERLRGVPAGHRTARYVCAAALAFPDGRVLIREGTCEGEILEVPRGTGGFGYDPLFYVPSLERSFAEVPAAEKHRLSHRGEAFRRMADLLRGAASRDADRDPCPSRDA